MDEVRALTMAKAIDDHCKYHPWAPYAYTESESYTEAQADATTSLDELIAAM